MNETSQQLRTRFLDFFRARGHTHVPSSPLVPLGDPTLLFTTAGMVQFKPLYTAPGSLPYTRATSVQKCLRLTDLERVGQTPRHDTFFEMLGNFSFGDYFKAEAIEWAWEFCRKELGLPREKLYASVFNGEGGFPEDDEARALWRKIGLPEARIVALGRADNFWGPAGGAGPCGPCSEIYFDLGPETPGACGRAECAPGCDCPRYMEFWNLVFPQYDADPDGTLGPLRNRGIDTGMGLERLALLVQGKKSIFETDLFAPIVERLAGLAGLSRAARAARTTELYIISDHLRALCFAVAEGTLPGNEGRGYVLRRLVRRAARRGRAVGLDRPFLGRVVEAVVREFGEFYPEIAAGSERIGAVLTREEESFAATFEAGMARLEKLIGDAGRSGSTVLSGTEVFELHDTYGFPLDLTEEIAAERGLSVDEAGFEKAMEGQRERSRAASAFESETGAAAAHPWQELTPGTDSAFVGYENMAEAGLAGRRWREAGAQGEPENLELVLDRTPFYAEAGGQVTDTGWLGAGPGRPVAHVLSVHKEGEAIVHRLKLAPAKGGAASGPGGSAFPTVAAALKAREEFLRAAAAGELAAAVDPARARTRRNHTATHLLHAALRGVLGEHVRQAGSLVSPERLRFDFAHFEAARAEQLREIEDRVNAWVLQDLPVVTEIKPLEEARAAGAMALFGEKYGATVRMVRVAGAGGGPDVSRELCGGTHVSRTGEIGPFVVVSEAGIASGTRRIEALTGEGALEHARSKTQMLSELARRLNTREDQIGARIEALQAEIEALKKREQERLKRQALGEAAGGGAAARGSVDGREWRVLKVEADSVGLLRELGDQTRAAIGSGCAVVGAEVGGKLSIVAVVTDDLVGKGLRADALVKEIAAAAGGSGGGKPHQALAGVKDPAQWGLIEGKAREVLERELRRVGA
ncbi:MAG TPA: alanine--tRNA ligase [Candidatus Saccharimonadales bacterium]|nr:alanine--tRNA ligase [Candidatus Saccharimonadales bacterium]